MKRFKRPLLWLATIVIFATIVFNTYEYELAVGIKLFSRFKDITMPFRFPNQEDDNGFSNFTCDRERWPNVQLFLTMPESMYAEFLAQFWSSALLFWPKSELNLTIVLDADAPNVNKFAEALKTKLSPSSSITVKYNQRMPYYKHGHDRQQLVMFWADNFTDSEYVGFVDTDTVFVTPVQKEDLFENNKSVIIAFYGKPQDRFWKKAPAKTQFALQRPEIVRCMSYFPVIFKTRHLAELRNYIAAAHGAPFNEVFQAIWSHGPYSQFNIMCNFLFHFHKDEYQWYIQESQPGWKGKPPKGQVRRKYLSAYAHPSMMYPKPRVATHMGYRLPTQNSLQEIFRLGKYYACAAINSTRTTKSVGNQTQLTPCDYNVEQFFFEFNSWTWHKDICAAFTQRQRRQRSCLGVDHNITHLCKGI